VVVMDSTGLPFTKDQIVSGLTETCNSIESSEQTEEFFCPAIKSLSGDGGKGGGDSGAASLTAMSGLLEKLVVYGVWMMLCHGILARFV